VLAQLIVRAAQERGVCTLGLAGGSTPIPVYRELARAGRIPWGQVYVYFGDERAVPPDHADSNYHAAQEALLRHVPIPAGQVFRMDGTRPDRDSAADDYAAVLPDRLDVLVLGVGLDGHTASLFPGAPALAELDRAVVPVVGPKPPPMRLTITPPVIARAREVVVLVTGAEKAAVVGRALAGPADPFELPVVLARHGTWVLDTAAASQVPHG
jgi:6-phosphogluconolactonase